MDMVSERMNIYPMINGLIIAFCALLPQLHCAPEQYTGTVTSFLVSQYKTGSDAAYYGSLAYVSNLGDITRPAIKNSFDQTVQRGTLLYSLNQTFWEKQTEGSREMMAYAKKAYIESIMNYKRYKYLVTPGAVSKEEFEEYLSTVSTNLYNYLNYRSQYIENQEFLKSSYQVASFEGIVDQVLYNQGMTAESAVALEVTMLNPIGIKIVIPREKAKMIGIDTPVKIFPVGSDKPQGIFYGYSMLNPDGMTFATFNKPALPPEAKGHKVIWKTSIVTKFYVDRTSDTLSVSNFALQSDDQGQFVWELEKPEKYNDNSLYLIKKVYVKTSGLTRLQNGALNLYALADAGRLKEGDLIVDDPLYKEMKDDETVCLSMPKYIFMPGDQVKVIIGK